MNELSDQYARLNQDYKKSSVFAWNLLNLYAVNEEEDYYDYWCGGPDEDYDINISKDEDVYNLNIFELVPTEFGTRRGYVVSYCRMKVIRENS